jgi:hypothetical protein
MRGESQAKTRRDRINPMLRLAGLYYLEIKN